MTVTSTLARPFRCPATQSFHWHPLALATALALLQLSRAAQAQLPPGTPAAPPPAANAASAPFSLPGVLTGGSRADGGKAPIFFEADQLEGEAGERTRATGSVRLRQGDMTMRADELTHTQADNMARALGHVRITKQGNVFTGPELFLQLDRLEGEFIQPKFWFARTQAGGDAERVEFLGENHLRAYRTSYTSCTPENTADGRPGEPDWALKTSEVDLNFATDEGRAKNAVVWFKGVPILAAPSMTFPLSDARKSGLLPPSFYFDSKSGFEFAQPYYWNIAPDQDATIAPTLSSRRGPGLDAEYRYLGEHDRGSINVFGLPGDRIAGRDRGRFELDHKGSRSSASSPSQTTYTLRVDRVSDDDYWKDFTHHRPSKVPRLYDSHARIEQVLNERNWGLGDSQTTLYGSVQTWQTLKDLDPKNDPTLSHIDTPYRRTPQLGVRSRSGSDTGLVWRLQGEFNRFTNEDTSKVAGNRMHATGRLERPFDLGGVILTPAVSAQSTHYDLDNALSNGSRSASRTIPTFSLDATMTLERPVNMFGRDMIQTLEPRIQYVRTPYRDQSILPLFDSAARDFNQYAIFSENAFTGADRVSDANQITVGATSRLLDPRTGGEALRLGVVQKVLLSDQRLNPNGEGPITQRLSDLLLLGSTSVIPYWYLDSTLQFQSQNRQMEHATASVRYSPGAWRTISATYRYNRESSEQMDLAWQWPLAGRTPSLQKMMAQASAPELNATGLHPAGAGQCGGTWYSVGRVSYSMRESRLISTLAGIEYDAGCWIGRFVIERVAIGQTKATSRLMFQLELVGLSRLALGTNPLRTLRDNIPGYQLLRNESLPTTANRPTPFTEDD